MVTGESWAGASEQEVKNIEMLLFTHIEFQSKIGQRKYAENVAFKSRDVRHGESKGGEDGSRPPILWAATREMAVRLFQG
jgi:hypothetical protein